MREHDDRAVIAIIGGGSSGAVVAHQIARRRPGEFRIVVIEPRDHLGGGLAYSTEEPAHRINVPATRMSFVPSDPCHFDRWLKADVALHEDPDALTADGRAFPRRSVFGRYAAATLEPYLLSGAIEHRVARATGATKTARGYAVTLSDGATLDADVLVLAATHPAPVAPAAFASLIDDPRIVVDAQRGGAFDAIPADARILIVGTGLTMADAVASLERRGHRGPIVAVSRRGLLSRGHGGEAGDFGDFSTEPETRASRLLLRIRRVVDAAEAQGLTWRNALDAVRTQAPVIWGALPVAERRRVVRRLRPFWDVHRFRVAPQIEAAIARLRAAGQLTVLKGEPKRVEADDAGLATTLRLAGGGERGFVFDRVILATGPAHSQLTVSDPLFAALAREGLVRLDDVGLGLAVDASSRAIGADGLGAEAFWVAGPLARGAFGELMGQPEVTKHAERVAGDVVLALLARGERRAA
ncbi:FAD/NAD(P)-binding protein [Methylopila henanensis]|uniref:FAD/NAD(P)-binding protein n=1 Tax=Methylopila henanensis TaxID=873516 RepID=A0ABW4K368_9HYPH